ncbi:MAG: hypothetical protein M0D57_11890 [Sphingobacteriales bacterium JAD_PAG50586_3]|nr:MAG: hypothetical protein M0D57_11890 [Sphingobacteriales bacterium JAD_PAG50586_3]
MKKTLLLLVTVLFTAGNNYAQSSYKFNIGESIQEPSMGISVSAGQDDENIFLVGFKPGLFSAVKYWFHSYNPKTLQQKAVVFQKMWADQFDGNYYFAADMMNDEPCMFTYEKVKGGVAINYYTFDKSTMAPSGKNMLVTIPGISVEMNQTTFVQEITEKVRPPQPDYSFTNMAYINFGISSPKYDQVMYVRSADKKTFYIVSLYDNGEQNANNSLAAVNVYAYDNSKTLLWTKSGKIPFDKWQSSIDGVDADNIGNVYFIIKNHHKKLRGESKGDNTPNYDYKLYYINKDKDDLQSVKLGTGDKFITSLTVKVYDDSVGARVRWFLLRRQLS